MAISLKISVLASGSSGNATIIEYGDDAIMIDAGIAKRELLARMCSVNCCAQPTAILLTHGHGDHVRGLKPIARHFQTDVYAVHSLADTLQDYGQLIAPPHVFLPGADFNIGPFQIQAMPVSHDFPNTTAYVICTPQHKVAIATDLGQPSKMLKFALKDCDAMILESNHDLNMLAASNRTWELKQRILGPEGHLSNRQCADLLLETISPNTKHLVLAHISEECNAYDIAKDNACTTLQEMNRNDVIVHIARQDEPLAPVVI